MKLTDIIGSTFRFEEIRSGLQSRTYSTGEQSFASFNLIGIAQRGHIFLYFDDKEIEISELDVFCIPHGGKAKIRVPAGSQAWLIGYHSELNPLILGPELDSRKLEVLMRRLTLGKGSTNDMEERLIPVVRLLDNEIRLPEHRSRSVICSLIRILLVTIYRLADIQRESIQEFPDQLILQRFRQLVEVEFRNRQPVSFYCEKLSITYDRLHAVCTRSLSESPLELLGRRSMIEATSLLTKTSESIQTISNQLGFSDASQFSHFFKRTTGVSPREYRKQSRSKTEQMRSEEHSENEFADWP